MHNKCAWIILKPSPPSASPWKNCLPWNWPLVPVSLRTTAWAHALPKRPVVGLLYGVPFSGAVGRGVEFSWFRCSSDGHGSRAGCSMRPAATILNWGRAQHLCSWPTATILNWSMRTMLLHAVCSHHLALQWHVCAGPLHGWHTQVMCC